MHSFTIMHQTHNLAPPTEARNIYFFFPFSPFSSSSRSFLPFSTSFASTPAFSAAASIACCSDVLASSSSARLWGEGLALDSVEREGDVRVLCPVLDCESKG